jgi:hypothetical protein
MPYSATKELVPFRPPGLLKRLTQRIAQRGLTGDFFSPEKPQVPLQPQTIGRRFDYPTGYNLWIQPRRDSGFLNQDLKNFARYYDLVRLVMQTRMDQVTAIGWSIVPMEDQKGKPVKSADQKVIDDLTSFWRKPDGRLYFRGWLRAMMNDSFTMDGMCLWPVFKGKNLAALERVDAATIKMIIDNSGRLAEPPFPAYQQILHGVVANEYRKDELLYYMENPQNDTVYGFSRIEQAMMTIQIGMRHEVSQLQFFTEGNIPDALASVPDSWTAEQIRDFQQWWDDMLAGDTAQRRHLKFIPDAIKVLQTKPYEAILLPEQSEWVARVLCYAFSVSAQPFIKQQSRGAQAAESSAEMAQEEGLEPYLTFLEETITDIIHNVQGAEDFQFKFEVKEEVDAASQATIDDVYVKDGIVSIDEVRDRLGKPQLGIGNMIYTPTGPIPIADILNGTFTPPGVQQPEAEPDPNDPNAGAGGGPPGAPSSPAPGGKPPVAGPPAVPGRPGAPPAPRAAAKPGQPPPAVPGRPGAPTAFAAPPPKKLPLGPLKGNNRQAAPATPKQTGAAAPKGSPQAREQRSKTPVLKLAKGAGVGRNRPKGPTTAVRDAIATRERRLTTRVHEFFGTVGGDIAAALVARLALSKVAVDALANEAKPHRASEAQRRAGNYEMGHLKVGPYDITIENPAGSHRSPVKHPEWKPLPYHYGYLKRTQGADGDHVDVCVRPGCDADFAGPVFVVDQVTPAGAFDEHKVMIGWHSRGRAIAAYLSAYPDGWRLGPVTRMSQVAFSAWLEDGDTTRPASAQLTKAADDEDDDWEADVAGADWVALIDLVEPALAAQLKAAGLEELVSVGYVDDDGPLRVSTRAAAYARARAAELVGMRYDEDGALIENAAPWSISLTTRNQLRSLVEQAVNENWSGGDLKSAILDSQSFSEARAQTIARTELSAAYTQGNLEAGRLAGATGKYSVLGSEHDVDVPDGDDCDDNADAGVIGFDEDFPSGDDAPPYHPNCVCMLVNDYGEADEESDDEAD